MATLNFNAGNNFIIPTENDMTYRGLGGNDVYIISKAIQSNVKIQIIDTEGSNTIQLIDDLIITNSLFTKNATRLTLENGSEITINELTNLLMKQPGTQQQQILVKNGHILNL